MNRLVTVLLLAGTAVVLIKAAMRLDRLIGPPPRLTTAMRRAAPSKLAPQLVRAQVPP